MLNKFADYSKHMPHLKFEYDEEYYPEDKDLPDPQVDPVIPGARVPINKVGVSGVDLPVNFIRRDGTTEKLTTSVSLYGSVDDPNIKGLNLSRFPIVMHEQIASHISIDGITHILDVLQNKQGSKDVYCKMKFKYPWTQKALRTRKELPDNAPDEQVFKIVDGIKLSHEKAEGYIYYNCILEGQKHANEYKFFLTVDYTYSSTCPCSFELAQDAILKRGRAANAHSQRSIAKIKIQFDHKNPVFIEDVVEMARKQVPTEVLVICKRRDEQAFAEKNCALVFTEDASRLFYEGLDQMFTEGRIYDFSVSTEHIESLHNFSASAVIYKGVPHGLR